VKVVKINANTVLTDLYGTPIRQRTEDGRATEKFQTVGSACVDALLVYQEKEMAGEIKLRRFELAQILVKAMDKAGKCELTLEQATEIKGVVGKAYGPLVVGRIHEIFENAANVDQPEMERKSA
jgi:hypothetical protein